MYTILIVDDEANLLEVLAVALENMGYGTVTAETAEEALAVLEEREVHLVLSDLRLPGLSGRELMEKVKAANPDLPVVIMTAYASLKEAVEIIKEGAFDYTVKPFELDALEATIASALRYYALGRDNRDLREQLQTASAGQFVGQSPAYLALLRNVREVSASSANVLITGESGTGKEVVAKAIHYGGPRAKAPLVTINCAAIPEQLLESELFGHARGAFTGATSNRKGRFAQADGGTLFLDEIGDMSLKTQAKILRILQEQSFERVGGTRTIKVDVRVIAATNKNLEEAIAAGTFREDLYYRLRVVPLHLPPLRERGGDLDLLLAAFTERLCRVHACKAPVYAPETMERLRRYPWPGNVRELRNFAERMVILFGGKTVLPVDLPPEMTPQGKPEPSAEAASAEVLYLPLYPDLLSLDRDFRPGEDRRIPFPAAATRCRPVSCPAIACFSPGRRPSGKQTPRPCPSSATAIARRRSHDISTPTHERSGSQETGLQGPEVLHRSAAVHDHHVPLGLRVQHALAVPARPQGRGHRLRPEDRAARVEAQRHLRRRL